MIKLNKLLLLTAFILTGSLLKAQNTTTIPLHPDVKHGVLDNGMHYYILKNQEPKERYSLYFAQNVGAILEEDSQDGLAHFLEHMAFNGLKNFPGKNMLNYLESYGIKFGANINAYTSTDQTVYNISNIPANNDNLLDSALLVLHDWSGGLLLEGEEIESERGVIREEWRTRRNSRFRLYSQTRPVIYNNSQYAKRDVIGSLDVINNFKHEELVNYYNKWYRPDLQAVIVVGDIDAEKVEEKVKALFSKIPAKENPTPRKYYKIDATKEPGFVVAKDKEAQYIVMNWIFRTELDTLKDENYIYENMARSILKTMLNNRLKELTRKPDCPALQLQIGNYTMARTQGASYMVAVPKNGKEKEAFELLYTEFERARRHGFNESELERTKTQILRSYESYLKEKDKISNNKWASKIGDYFLEAKPLPTVEWETEFAKSNIPKIKMEEVEAQFGMFHNVNNSAISITGPEDEEINYPTKEELLSIVSKVSKKELEPYKDDALDIPLISKELKETKITETKPVQGVDATVYKLENGAKVVIMPTELSKDEILFKAFSFGGSSLLTKEDLPSADMAATIARMSGIGEFSAVQLKKKLTGKLARVNPSIGSTSENLSGSASPKDFETMLQLIYLYFENPRFEKDIYATIIENLNNQLKYLDTDNKNAFRDTISNLNNNYSERNILFGEEFVKSVDFEKAKTIFKDRFKDASDFTFVFVGNINADEHLPLITKYVGNITDISRTETWVNHNIKPADGYSVRELLREMEIPKSSVYYSVYSDVKYNLETRTYVRVISDLLSKRYLDTIREEEGGTYGVGVRPGIYKRSYEHATITMNFDCDPEKREKLTKILKAEIDNLIKSGVNETDLKEIKESFLKNREEAEDKNSFWLSVISGSLLNDEAITSTEDFNELVKSLTAKKVQKFAKKFFKDYDAIEVYMNPIEEAKTDSE